MNNNLLMDTLGQCWSFPPSFCPDKGVIMTKGIQSVLQSLRVLFMTVTGERIMRETWGSDLDDCLFENVSDELLTKIHNHIEESILRYEPRVILKDVLIQPEKGEASRLQIQITVALSGSDITETLAGTLNVNDGQTLRLL